MPWEQNIVSHSGSNSGDSAVRLAALRAEIDAVDEALHDLVMRRAALSHDLGALKAGDTARAGDRGSARPGNPVRPAREAVILRRLAARHSGALPFAVVVRIWRELMAANLNRQCRFGLAVLETSRGLLWDTARAAYGALTPVEAYSRPQEIIDALSESPGLLGIFPSPAEAPPEHRMWPELLAAKGAPRILCALPHLARGPWPRAFAVGYAPNEPSGDDLSFLLLSGSAPVTPETEEPAAAGLEGRIEAVWPALSSPGLYCAFAVVRGFLTPDDPALAALGNMRRQADGSAQLIGTAPAPLQPPDG